MPRTLKNSEGNNMHVTSSATNLSVWRPGVDAIDEGDELMYDPSAYNALHSFDVGGKPCLSFDILGDSLGLVRTEFPHTVFGVAGTQVAEASKNTIGIFKISNIRGKKRELLPRDNDDGESSSDSDMDEEEEGASLDPILQLREVFHEGGINRIRSMKQKPHICASWGDNGHVQVWDMGSHINALVGPDARGINGGSRVIRQAPLMKFKGHKDEGYALDWSPRVPGRLVTGDCKSCIHLWNPASSGCSAWNVDPNSFVGHQASVEDLQWSPENDDIFASCSVDGHIAVWDIRCQQRTPMISIKAHKADVNVISWNSLRLMASGSDDGSFSIRDFRHIRVGSGSTVAHFEYHKHPITSIEWSPHEESTLAVSSSDNQLTVWDLSLERDEEEEAEFRAKTNQQVNAPNDLPPQLLFVHQGQKDLKEIHWHSQIPGMIISTAADGFNILMPSNIQTTLPPA